MGLDFTQREDIPDSKYSLAMGPSANPFFHSFCARLHFKIAAQIEIKQLGFISFVFLNDRTL